MISLPIQPASAWKDGMEGLFALPEDVYRKASGVSQSEIKAMQRSPAHCLAYREEQREPTKAMLKGTALHTQELEPHNWKEGLSHWVLPATYPAPATHAKVKDKEDPTKEGDPLPWNGGAGWCKAWMETKSKESKLPFFTVDDIKELDGMLKALSSHPVSGPALSEGVSEVAAFCIDKQTGLMRKARVDKIVPDDNARIGVADVKKCQDARFWDKDGFKLGAPIQAYSNLQILKDLGLDVSFFIFIAVEESAPHGIQIWNTPPAWLDYGERWYRHWLDQYAACTKSGIWPGYSEEIKELSLPEWAKYPTIN